jgi:sterol 3beta-glucosyltransferase
MRVLIATIGTRGDVQPYVALAIGLKAAGHQVTICTCPQFREFVSEHGIGFESLEDGLLKLLESNTGRELLENLNGVFGVLRTIPRVLKQVGPIHRRMVDDCWAAVTNNDPDIIIYHPKMFCVPAFAAVRNIPAILAMLCPMHVPTGDSPMFGKSMGRFYNRCTYQLVHKLTKLGTKSYLRSWRSEFDLVGISRDSSTTHILAGKPIPVMHAHSQFVCPRPSDWPEYASVTGYWFLPLELPNNTVWEAPRELSEFLDSGQPPVYFGFGSMAGSDPSKLTQIILAAVKKTGVRAIISTGWGGVIAVKNSPTIHVLESAPHEWLFPKMAAVVHHGGAGTTAAGLRAACPTIICPYGLDQPFWGRRVAELGVGVAPIPQKKLNDRLLADAINSVMTDASYRNAAIKIAESIKTENGIANAIKAIEKISLPKSEMEK